MVIKMNNDRSAELVYLAYRNVDGGGSITQRTPVCINVDGASVNGLNAMNPSAVNRKGWIGIARTTVAINGYGLAAAWGQETSCLISNVGSSITVTAGDALITVAGVGLGCFSSVTAISFTNHKYAVAGSTVTISAAAYVDNVQVRCL